MHQVGRFFTQNSNFDAPDLFSMDVRNSKEGVAQGHPLAIVAHVILMLPLVRLLKESCSDYASVSQADDGNVAGDIVNIRKFFQKLCLTDPDYGCYPKARKIILLVPEMRLRIFAKKIIYHLLQSVSPDF